MALYCCVNIDPAEIGRGRPVEVGIVGDAKAVLMLHGDGSFGMNAMEMDTAVRHNLPIVTVISLNGGWTADPEGRKIGRQLGYQRYEKLMDAFGGHGEYVENPADSQLTCFCITQRE